MTPDGRYVAFISTATNLVAGDTNGTQDVFVRDLIGGVTSLVSAGATGTNVSISPPLITPDGRFVAFASTAKGLVSSVSASSQGEVYVRDLVSNVTIWASTNAANLVSNVLRGVTPPPVIRPSATMGGLSVLRRAWRGGQWFFNTTFPLGSRRPSAPTALFPRRKTTMSPGRKRRRTGGSSCLWKPTRRRLSGGSAMGFAGGHQPRG